MITLNNFAEDFFKETELKGKVTKIPQEDIDESIKSINEKMEEAKREFKYLNAKSNYEASKHYFTF